MAKLPRIPSPPRVIFREIRIAVLPFVAFAVVLGLTAVTWRNYVGPATLVGEVEPVRAYVSTPQDGQLITLSVGLLDRVSIGQTVGQVLPIADPRTLISQLALRWSRIGHLRDAVDARLRQQNNEIAYAGLRLDWMNQRAELAMLRAQQSYFQLELNRQERLSSGGGTNRLTSDGVGNVDFSTFLGPEPANNGAPSLDRDASAVSDNYQSPQLSGNLRVDPGRMLRNYSIGAGSPSRLNSVSEYEVARRDYDSLTAEIEERARLVEEIELSLSRLTPEEARLNEEAPAALRAALEIEEQELRTLEKQLGPVDLVATVDGVVAAVHRRAGENVTAGEWILTLSGDRAERVIGFIRQPIKVDIQLDMPVEVRCRGRNRESGLGRVLAVGTQLEPIFTELLPWGTSSNTVELGLPFLISLPPTVPALGGETVDLIIRRN